MQNAECRIKVLSNVISSQIEIHKLYGGVVPEIASRNHVLAIQTVYEEALRQAGVTLDDITQIAATTHPGLRGAVMVGQVFAESLAVASKKPFIEVNHLAGHIASVSLRGDCHVASRSSQQAPQFHGNPEPPFLTLLVSGGHTSLYKVTAWDNIELLCETADDAVGEAFDKVAKLLGLGYPGGPAIAKEAEKYQGKDFIQFVNKPNKKDGFSYSGLKTAVLNYLQKNKDFNVARLAASFQHEAIMQLVDKCKSEMKRHNIETLCVCGGVAANKYLREHLPFAYFPAMEYCTDNAAMIGAAAVLGVFID